MRGVQRVRVWRRRYCDFRLELRRNITVVRGDSGTGKSTLFDMVTAHMESGDDGPVRIQSEHEVVALTSYDWEHRLSRLSNSVVIVDEGSAFVRSHEFAAAVKRSSNYYVLITREALPQLPYSVNEVYEMKTSGRIHTLKPVHVPSKGLTYGTPARTGGDYAVLLTEDSGSGLQFFRSRLEGAGVECVSARGRSNVFSWLDEHKGGRVFVVADGAAFGPEADLVLGLQRQHPDRITLCLPESFEWLLLRSGLVRPDGLGDVLENTAEHVDSERHESWEKFFSDYLREATKDKPAFKCDKSALGPGWLTPEAGERVMRPIARGNVR